MARYWQTHVRIVVKCDDDPDVDGYELTRLVAEDIGRYLQRKFNHVIRSWHDSLICEISQIRARCGNCGLDNRTETPCEDCGAYEWENYLTDTNEREIA